MKEDETNIKNRIFHMESKNLLGNEQPRMHGFENK
jgi:hypothetical protein